MEPQFYHDKQSSSLFSFNGANFSECRKYRYALFRIWDNRKPLLMVIGLNPSTANELSDDPTIRRVINFANSLGYGGVYMMNCWAYVSTNPDDLKIESDNGLNDRWLRAIKSICADVLFAWGAFKVVKESGRAAELSAMFPDAKCFVKNKDGSPKHPLYVHGKTQPIKY